MTVGELKSQFAAQSNTDIDAARMIFNGRQLTDPTQKLSDLHITSTDCTLHAVFRLGKSPFTAVSAQTAAQPRLDPEKYTEEQKKRKEEYDLKEQEYERQRAEIL